MKKWEGCIMLLLLPCEPGVCQECAIKHKPDKPHNKNSLYYQYKFYGQHGRWPRWSDAIAHCSEKVQELWKLELIKRGVWDKVV